MSVQSANQRLPRCSARELSPASRAAPNSAALAQDCHSIHAAFSVGSQLTTTTPGTLKKTPSNSPLALPVGAMVTLYGKMPHFAPVERRGRYPTRIQPNPPLHSIKGAPVVALVVFARSNRL